MVQYMCSKYTHSARLTCQGHERCTQLINCSNGACTDLHLLLSACWQLLPAVYLHASAAGGTRVMT